MHCYTTACNPFDQTCKWQIKYSIIFTYAIAGLDTLRKWCGCACVYVFDRFKWFFRHMSHHHIKFASMQMKNKPNNNSEHTTLQKPQPSKLLRIIVEWNKTCMFSPLFIWVWHYFVASFPKDGIWCSAEFCNACSFSMIIVQLIGCFFSWV